MRRPAKSIVPLDSGTKPVTASMKPDDLTGLHRDVDAVDGDQAPEGDLEGVRGQQRHSAHRLGDLQALS